MNVKEIERLVKKLNQRAVEVYRQFGSNNSTYQSYMNYFNKIASKTGYDLKESRSGAYNLPRSKAFYNSINEYTLQDLKRAENRVYTVGILKKKTKEQILRERQEHGIKNKRVTKEEIRERIESNSWVHDFIETHSAEIYEYQELHDAVKRSTKLTQKEIEDLRKIANQIEAGGDELTEFIPFERFQMPPDE